MNLLCLVCLCTGNVWENYIVTKNFEGEADSKQLSLKKGDTIQIIRKDDSGWWMGTNGKMAGWVPPSYLRPASTLMESPDEEDSDVIGLNIPGGKVIDTEEYKAIDDFEAEEDSQVSFKEGDIITVVDKEEDGEETLKVDNNLTCYAATLLCNQICVLIVCIYVHELYSVCVCVYCM